MQILIDFIASLVKGKRIFSLPQDKTKEPIMNTTFEKKIGRRSWSHLSKRIIQQELWRNIIIHDFR